MYKFILFSLIAAFLISGCCDSQSDNVPVADVKPEPFREVLLLGTFHFNNPGADIAKTNSFDIMSEKSQHELDTLSEKIKAYNPEKIFVEWSYDDQARLDSLYQLYLAGKYFENEKLSNFYLKNEIFQLAFRAAQLCGHKRVYAVDYENASFPYDSMMTVIEAKGQTTLKARFDTLIAGFVREQNNAIQSGTSLTQMLLDCNTPIDRELANEIHTRLPLGAGDPDNFIGPYLTSEWYKRNLFIWSGVLKHAGTTDNRVMVLLGSSHTAMLEKFIKDDPNWKVKELAEILN